MAPRHRSAPKETRKDSQWDLQDAGRGIDVEHKESDSAWTEFNEISQLHDSRYAHTVPGLDSVPMPPEERGWADTQPTGAGMKPDEAAAAPQPRRRDATLEEAMRYVRSKQRVCPRPEVWDLLCGLLPPLKMKSGTRAPPRPITGSAWQAAPTRAKRAIFLEHIEWASRTGVLAPVMEFLHALPEDDWLHVGEQ